jgi:hypothetical protein
MAMSSKVELKASTSWESAARESTVEMKRVLLASSPERIEATPASSHVHLVDILSSVISHTFVFITKHLKLQREHACNMSIAQLIPMKHSEN